MTIEEFRAQMLEYACGAGKALMDISVTSELLEQEQVRKNASTILVILTETEDFLKTFNIVHKNECSNS
ncbi:MAG: hypothetical protein K2H90_02755 [Oscillospiraceae bacterium]|nr:hypothetical protein [Oscillospiraceae bacterium]